MSNQNDSDGEFKFFPRPEAHTARWSDLLSPVQAALRNLLVRIAGTVETVTAAHHHGSEDDITNCFLVYGDRGTGKTTVLLAASCFSSWPATGWMWTPFWSGPIGKS